MKKLTAILRGHYLKDLSLKSNMIIATKILKMSSFNSTFSIWDSNGVNA